MTQPFHDKYLDMHLYVSLVAINPWSTVSALRPNPFTPSLKRAPTMQPAQLLKLSTPRSLLTWSPALQPPLTSAQKALNFLTLVVAPLWWILWLQTPHLWPQTLHTPCQVTVALRLVTQKTSSLTQTTTICSTHTPIRMDQ